MKLYSIISDIQYYLPSRLLSNEDLVSENPDWRMDDIEKKTGIKKLYLSSKDEDVLDLSIKSCKKTLKNFDKNKIDCVIVVTQTAKKNCPLFHA